MTRYVALLRGINVGRNKRIAMADLRDLLESLGHARVVTHLQSGNAIFDTDRAGAATLAGEIETAIRKRLGMEVRVLLRTPAELAKVIRANPLRQAEAEPFRLLVTFLDTKPSAANSRALERDDLGNEVVRVVDRAVYLWYRKGVGESKLTNAVIEKRLGSTSTARNWNTVLKLDELARAVED